MMPFRRSSTVCLLSLLAFTTTITASTLSACAQQAPAPASQPKAGSNWQRVEALPARTKVHITTDHGGRTCHIFSVTDDALTCEASSGKAGRVIQKTEIRHIKLTHYVRSTLMGTGIGTGIGVVTGAIVGRKVACSPNTTCLNTTGSGVVAAAGGVAGAVIGAIVGGTTDQGRGSSIYVRP